MKQWVISASCHATISFFPMHQLSSIIQTASHSERNLIFVRFFVAARLKMLSTQYLLTLQFANESSLEVFKHMFLKEESHFGLNIKN